MTRQEIIDKLINLMSDINDLDDVTDDTRDHAYLDVSSAMHCLLDND